MNFFLRKIICQNLKLLRKRNGYSQVDIADLLNIEQNTYSRLESGITKIEIERLDSIANLYNLPIESFFKEIM